MTTPPETTKNCTTDLPTYRYRPIPTGGNHFLQNKSPLSNVEVRNCQQELVFAKQTPRHTRGKTGSRRKNLFLQNKCRPDRSPPISLMEMKQDAPALAHHPAPGHHLRRGDGRLLALVEFVVARPFFRMPDVGDRQNLINDGGRSAPCSVGRARRRPAARSCRRGRSHPSESLPDR